jgi:ATP-dependent helicase HrpB
MGDSDLLHRVELLDQARRERFAGHLRDRGIDPIVARQVALAADEFARMARRIGARRGDDRSRPESRGRENRDSRARDDREWQSRESRLRESQPGGSRSPEAQSLGGGTRGEQWHRDAEGRNSVDRDFLLKLPLLAYPDRVCRRRASDPSAAVMVDGSGVRLLAESMVREAEFFLALDARHDPRNASQEAQVRIASAIRVEWLEELFPEAIVRRRSVVFDEERQRVVGLGTVSYRGLVLSEDRDAAVDPRQAGMALAEALKPRAVEIFEADEKTAAVLARIALLRQWMPEHAWPALDATELEDLLKEVCAGKRSVAEVKSSASAAAIESRLGYPLDRLLAEHAPETIEVPSGSRIKVEYRKGQVPVLAARLQELFGWTDTPRIAGGRVALVVHLLGPNYRPVQITDDLRSFWQTAYFQVRKDLRVRYPKHSWPEQPLTAKAEAKGKRR